MKVQELYFRDCPWCGVRDVAMTSQWSRMGIPVASGKGRTWLTMACPRCGGIVSLEVSIETADRFPGTASVPSSLDAAELRSVPDSEHASYRVSHLPEDVERFYSDALRVMEAGVPDAAAVQLRRTIEACAAHKGVGGKNLVQMVEAMIENGIVTRDFGDVLTHVRKLGNIGAHASDERLSDLEVRRALGFTTQFLRNVFEVPGELAELATESDRARDPLS